MISLSEKTADAIAGELRLMLQELEQYEELCKINEKLEIIGKEIDSDTFEKFGPRYEASIEKMNGFKKYVEEKKEQLQWYILALMTGGKDERKRKYCFEKLPRLSEIKGRLLLEEQHRSRKGWP